MAASSSAARRVALAPEAVSRVAVATPEMLPAMSELPLATSVTLRAISLVVAVCSSTALAMLFWISWIWVMMEVIVAMAATASRVSLWIASIRLPISSVADAVSRARVLTSLATTANPLPLSPARAASIVALSARRLVCSEMFVITLVISLMRELL